MDDVEASVQRPQESGELKLDLFDYVDLDRLGDEVEQDELQTSMARIENLSRESKRPSLDVEQHEPRVICLLSPTTLKRIVRNFLCDDCQKQTR